MFLSSQIQLKMMMTLPLLTLTLVTVSGDPTWIFTSPPATKHDKENEVRSFQLDNPGFNAIVTALRYENYKIKVRLIPPKNKLNYSEDKLSPFKWIKPCVPKPDQNELTCVNYTDQNTTCTLNIDLPCKAKPGHSRWEANLLTDITVKKETNLTVDDCQVVCLDIGYFDEDVYKGGEWNFLRANGDYSERPRDCRLVGDFWWGLHLLETDIRTVFCLAGYFDCTLSCRGSNYDSKQVSEKDYSIYIYFIMPNFVAEIVSIQLSKSLYDN